MLSFREDPAHGFVPIDWRVQYPVVRLIANVAEMARVEEAAEILRE